jgi:glyoxylase-like metal-dependent hydrolase (beta-lactamase superfamily II)
VAVEVRDVAPGLWLWRQPHPEWEPGHGWEAEVASFCVEGAGEVVLLDALAPPEGERDVWERLDASPPTVAVVLKPDHVRDVDVFVRRYNARAFGPEAFNRDDIPETELEQLVAGDTLPGGLQAQFDGRARLETPMYLPEQRALVFADALQAQGEGAQLQVWSAPWRFERALPGLRQLLELPFEHVIVAHGEPVHDRAAFERALTLPPYTGPG